MKELARIGYTTRTEVARDYIMSLRSHGVDLRHATSDVTEFTREIVCRGRQVAEDTDPQKLIIFDRSLTDVLAFALIDGLDVKPLIGECAKYHFALVFQFERADLREDGTIYHTPTQLKDIGQACGEIYTALGCDVIRVPLMSTNPQDSVAARATFVRDKISAWARHVETSE